MWIVPMLRVLSMASGGYRGAFGSCTNTFHRADHFRAFHHQAVPPFIASTCYVTASFRASESSFRTSKTSRASRQGHGALGGETTRFGLFDFSLPKEEKEFFSVLVFKILSLKLHRSG